MKVSFRGIFPGLRESLLAFVKSKNKDYVVEKGERMNACKHAKQGQKKKRERQGVGGGITPTPPFPPFGGEKNFLATN